MFGSTFICTFADDEIGHHPSAEDTASIKTYIYMSKGNMLLGHARGKVGSLVFSRVNGKQVTRAKAEVVKNPRTEAQKIQRIILNTVAQAYSRFKAICDHSFEGVQQGQRSASYFMKKNIDLVRSTMVQDINDGFDLGSIYAFSPLNTNEYAANAFIIAKGTLPEQTVTFTGSTGAILSGIADNTYEGVINSLGLKRGDQLTFVATQGTSGSKMMFHYARVILDPRNADGSEAELSSPFISNGSVNLPNPRNEGVFSTLTYATGSVTFAFSAQPMAGAAVIVSRKLDDGNWLRSNATLAVNTSAVAGFQHSMQECLDLAASGNVDTENPLYLNNAGTARTASAGGSAELTPITVVDAAGNSVTIHSLRESGGYLVAVTADDVEYYIKGDLSQSPSFGKWLTSLTTIGGDEPADTTHVIGLSGAQNPDAGSWSAFCNWLVGAGVDGSIITSA